VHVRFRTDNLRPTRERGVPYGRCGGRRLVAATARSGRASGGNAAAIPHLSAAPFDFSLRGTLTALRREGRGGGAHTRVPPPLWPLFGSVVRNGILRSEGSVQRCGVRVASTDAPVGCGAAQDPPVSILPSRWEGVDLLCASVTAVLL